MPLNVIKPRLNSLRRNLPTRDVEQTVVDSFNSMVDQLEEELPDPEISHFKVAASDLKPLLIQVIPGQGAKYTKDKYCDPRIFKQQVEGLWEYLVDSNLIEGDKPEPKRKNPPSQTVNIHGNRNVATPADMPKQPPTHQGLSIFISHSSKDADLALALIDLLKAGMALTADQIRCSSVDGYRLPVGVNSEGKLREEVNAAKVVVGLITRSSLTSYYVMF